MNRKIFIAIIFTTISFGVYYLFLKGVDNKDLSGPGIIYQEINDESPAEKVDHTAAFAIYTNNIFRIFTASMYHNLSEIVYIEPSNPNIVIIKMSGITWDDFFDTLPFVLTKKCLTTGTGETFCDGQNGKLRFYINGNEDVDALDRKINDKDKLLVTFGNESENKIKSQLQSIRVN